MDPKADPALLARIERQFGVPATLLMAIWTLESDRRARSHSSLTLNGTPLLVPATHLSR
jgi:hypothetical protein